MIGRRDYETRKAARIARLEARAERLRAEGSSRLDSARRIGAMIPMGQPILIGHHSEKRHRKDLARIDAGYRKGFAALEQAESCERRAAAAEENRAISSDDPAALDKLRAKLAALEAAREQAAALNKAGRAKDPAAALAALGVKDPAAFIEKARLRFNGDRAMVPAYRLTNMAAEARRLRKRIEGLERRDAAPERAPEEVGEVRIVEEDNRVQIVFPGKPAAEVRSALKSRGFRWAPTMGAWVRMASNGAWHDAREIAGKIAAPAA